MDDISIRPIGDADHAAVAGIYNHYIRETVVTFEEVEIDAGEIARRVDRVSAQDFPWLVVERGARVAGYAYAATWNERSAYRHTAQTAIYLDTDATGRGIGTAVYGALLDHLRRRSVHVAIGGISLPNPGSVALHEKFGFEKVAHFKEVGFKLGRWIDVGYWQKALAR